MDVLIHNIIYIYYDVYMYACMLSAELDLLVRKLVAKRLESLGLHLETTRVVASSPSIKKDQALRYYAHITHTRYRRQRHR